MADLDWDDVDDVEESMEDTSEQLFLNQLYSSLSNANSPVELAFRILAISIPLSLENLGILFDGYDDFMLMMKRLEKEIDADELDLVHRVLFWTLIRSRKDAIGEDYPNFKKYYSEFMGKVFATILEHGGNFTTPISSARQLLMEMIEEYPSPLRAEHVSVVEQIRPTTTIDFLIRMYHEIKSGQAETGYESSHISDLVDEDELASLDPSEVRGPLRQSVLDYQDFNQLPHDLGTKRSAKKKRTGLSKRQSSAMRRALTKARSLGFKDYSPAMRKMISSAIRRAK